MYETSPNGGNIPPFSWFSDASNFMRAGGVFAFRGGAFDAGSEAGIFGFSYGSGAPGTDGFRVVLTP